MTTSILLANATTLETYDMLQKKGREPQLGLYSSGKLTIVNVKAETWTDALIQSLNKIINFVYKQLGVLNLDPNKIEAAKDIVNQFYINKQVVFMDPKQEQLRDLIASYDTKKSEHETLLNDHYTLAHNHQAMLEEYSKKSSELLIINETLPGMQEKLKEVSKDLTTLEPKREELRVEIARLQDEHVTLLNELKTNSEKVDQIKKFDETIQSLTAKTTVLDEEISKKESQKKELLDISKKLEEEVGLHKSFKDALEAGKAIGIREAQNKQHQTTQKTQFYCNDCINALKEAMAKRKPWTVLKINSSQGSGDRSCGWPMHNQSRDLFRNYGNFGSYITFQNQE